MAAVEAPAPRPMIVVPSWIEAHCVVPDGFKHGKPFRLYDSQLEWAAAFYLVRGDAEWIPEAPLLSTAFVYRTALITGPQKLGKDPGFASIICNEAVGPALFGGWAGRDDGYACRDHGCRCGWEYAYDPGEPMGMRWPTPRIQITAISEDQTDNTYGALRPMIDDGPLHDLIPNTGAEFIRLPGAGEAWIRTVTSSAQSRLGNPITFAVQGEVGLWTKRNGMIDVATTQGRGLAGMQGRSMANTNAWDPSEDSIAARRWNSKATDIYRYFVQAPANLSFANKAERRKIFKIVYPKDVRREGGGHLDIDAIEAECFELMETDAPQAERFFGNRLVKGAGKAFNLDRWLELRVQRPHEVPKGALITIGGDGSVRWDHYSLIATEVASGYQWPLGIWRPQDHEGEIPSSVVDAVLGQAFEDFDVWRFYCDPPYVETWLAAWAGRWGADRVVEWWTNRPRAMAYATRSWVEAQAKGEVSHCPESHPLCGLFSEHVGNAVKDETGYEDDQGRLWVPKKDRKGSPNKIDSDPAAILSWEARNDAIAAGALNVESQFAYDGMSEEEIVGRMLGLTEDEIAERVAAAAEVEA